MKHELAYQQNELRRESPTVDGAPSDFGMWPLLLMVLTMEQVEQARKWGDHTQRHGSGRSDSHDDEEGRTHEVRSSEERHSVKGGGTTLKDLAAAKATPRTMRKAEPSEMS